MTLRACLALLLLSVILPWLGGCGDDPVAPPGPEPESETWFYAPEEMMRLVANRDPGGMAWIPAATLAELEKTDMANLATVVALLRDTVVARLTLAEDATFVLSLRAEQPDGAWRTVTARGTWAAPDAETIRLAVAERESLQLAPLEIDDVLTVKRVGKYLHLAALGRTVPFMQVALPR